MATWEEIRDEVAGMLADGKPLEEVIGKLEQRKNEMAKANLLKAMDDMKKREQTNEEWFCGLSTEEKAEWLSKHLHCGDCDIENRECFGTYSGCKETLIKWLKEIHE